MIENKWFDVDYGIHVVFSTAPQSQEKQFERHIEGTYFENFQRGAGDEKFLYHPLKYYLLGDYDLCYITLINNFKFAHRLFEPTGTSSEYFADFPKDTNVYDAHTFQSYTGFALDSKTLLQDLFDGGSDKPFCGIINMKLNNGLLIGNGFDYTKAVVSLLRKKLEGFDFLISHTFSWFELSMVLFIDSPEQLGQAILEIRSATLAELIENEGNEEMLNNSLYCGLYGQGEDAEKLRGTGLFADSHTYFGFHSDIITTNDKDAIAAFEEKFKDVVLKTEIQWQIKPGHGVQLQQILQGHPVMGKYFELPNGMQHVLGKWDMVIKNKQEDQSILCSYHFLRSFHGPDSSNDGFDFTRHIRRTTTQVYLSARFNNAAVGQPHIPINLIDELQYLAQSPKRIEKAIDQLKALKISRNLRIKIFKIFSNYNNGIQDPILFPYFLDFTMFTEYLLKIIDEEYKRSQKKAIRLSELEQKLHKHVKVFQEGYNVRFLNGYQFENISDFDLDFNSSVQQLLTSYNVLASEYGKLFYKDKNFSRIIQLNNGDTTSNYLSINFSIHHLTSPEFAFTTLLKEILNHQALDNSDLDRMLKKFKSRLEGIKEKYNDSYLDDLLDWRGDDINYFIIDSLRFIITFSGDFELFEYWFWSYNFQNASLYTTSGMFYENQLRIEMLRLMLVKEFFKIKGELKCPTSELYTYWERHEARISKCAKNLAQEIKDLSIVVTNMEKQKSNYSFASLLKSIFDRYSAMYNQEAAPASEFEGKQRAMFAVGDRINSNNLFEKKLAFLFEPTQPGEPIKEMDRYIYNFLEHRAKSSNDGKVVVLPRDWNKGNVLSNNLEATDSNFTIDTTGGIFFSKLSNPGDYFKDAACCIMEIIDFAYKAKRSFIMDYITKTKMTSDEK